MRDNNSAMFSVLGPDTGYDSMGDRSYAEPLAQLLNALSSAGNLPRTILYNVNPRDTEMLASMLGCFEDGSVPGKMQLGAAWWFLDQKDGIERQLEAISQIGSLRRFVGMVADSRSFLSFSRHEYFRRILCNVLGADMAAGLLPRDFDLVGALVEDVCFRNAASFFRFELPDRPGEVAKRLGLGSARAGAGLRREAKGSGSGPSPGERRWDAPSHQEVTCVAGVGPQSLLRQSLRKRPPCGRVRSPSWLPDA